MKCVVISTFCSKEKYKKLIKKDFRSTQQYQKYFRLLCGGLLQNGAAISVLSIPPVNHANCKKVIVNETGDIEDGVAFNYIPTINIPILKNLFSFFGALFYLFRFGRDEDTVIITDLLNVTSSIVSFIGARILGKKTLGILTDMPAVYVDNENGRVTLHKRINQWLCERGPNCYLFLTEAMNSYVNRKKKPYVVVEGFSDINLMQAQYQDEHINSDKFCFYAGGLNKLYGLDMLVEGFIQAQINDCVLRVCGDGPYTNELKQICKDYHCVEYLGVLDNSEVLELEKAAALLINPRYTHSEFTKYSFPSKNMEYMSTGTPVLTTKLAGMPEEYHQYVFLLDEETVDGMKSKLRSILSLDTPVLREKGMRAKKWILEKKNNVEGTKCIYKMLESLS